MNNTENTRKFFTKEITVYLQNFILKTDEIIKDKKYSEYQRQSKILDSATIDQLLSMYLMTLQERDFTIICNTDQYIAINHANMFIGIEMDGHTHS